MNTRIAGYDFARSLAVFGLVVGAYGYHLYSPDFYLLDTFSQGWITTTFLVLGGIGMSLLRQRDQRTNPAHRSVDSRTRLIKRAASLLVVGICCNLIWQTYFLCFYSICIVIGALLLTVSNRWLWALAFIFVLIWATFTFWVLFNTDVFKTLQDSDPWTAEGTAFRLSIYSFHSIFFWTGSLLIGMWLGRWNVHDPRVRRSMFLGGIAVVLVPACIVWLLGRYTPPNIWVSADGETIRRLLFVPIFMPIHFSRMCGIATAIIGGCLMLTEKYPDAKWTKPFIATGQLALTLYVAHLVVSKWLLKELEAADIYPFGIENAVIFCICAVIFSHFWSKLCERGPLEWGMRRITG